MSDNDVMHLAVQAMIMGAKLAAPILIISLVMGFIISLLQSVTQVQEMTLTFVPKLIAVALILLFLGNWMMTELVTFTQGLIRDIPNYLQR
ncbi:flagellar biosynthetic protein FliQ [Kineosphaera limosa]|uniref:Flagellar biosynthetic protein FliQ n=1 Tax=Kineosphaera limosa NBRC 100340 TaxID=1184609 RepID=K6VI44_9MICO|nr:flagellar biosynthesis protein FliQ [Kineosphaera limosa]NYD99787.1 flagellar biosynthetic protein FliQ [Kineosphaera limosa]GAB95888.1 putative flagellar biosynthetic protein FliQ [Kineosphaera limosa NBRC 100340]